MATLSDIAAKLAQDLPVFPCKRDKTPLVKGGFKSAARGDAARKLFESPGAELIGMPTGAASGLVAIDIDVHGKESGLVWHKTNEDRLPRTRVHTTRSGGLHLLFRTPASVEIRNSASRVAPGVDVRGEGGYVIVPPSPGYAVKDDSPPADMPPWLVTACIPPKRDEQPAATETSSALGSRYGLKALAAECEAIGKAGFGKQENTLNAAALKIGALVAGGEISQRHARAELLSAAALMPDEPGRPPWRQREIDQKIDRALADGGRTPRSAPEPAPKPILPKPKPTTAKTHLNGHSPDHVGATTPLPLVWYEEIESRLDTADFVEGILVNGSAAVLYGESNSGKTFLACDLALHVAAGKEWMGRSVDAGGVVYCALEGSFGLSNRVAAWRQHHGVHDLPFAVITASLNLLDPTADTPRLVVTALSAASKMEPPLRLIVVDTLARSMIGGSENEAADMGAIITNMDELRRQTSACVLFVHHTGKDPSRGSRGHSSLRAAIDTEIEVRHEKEDPVRVASVVKQRELGIGVEIGFSLRVVTLGQNARGRDVTTCIVVPEQAVGERRTRLLTDRQKTAMEILNDLLARAGEPDYAGVPAGVPSVPDQWWRERFYERALPGADLDAKQKAFRRVADSLIAAGVIGLSSGRVWICQRREQSQHQSQPDVRDVRQSVRSPDDGC